MIETTDGSKVAATCATDPAGRLTAGCTAAGAADPDVDETAATAGTFVVFFVAATSPPATSAPISAAIPATANNDGQPDRRPALVDRGSAGSPYGCDSGSDAGRLGGAYAGALPAGAPYVGGVYVGGL
jgi:hypothetical protein